MRKGWRLAIVALLVLATVGAFAGGKQESTKEPAQKTEAAKTESKVKIGLTTFDLSNPYWVKLVEGAQKRAGELGYEVVVINPDGDVTKQINGLENFIAMGCKTIIVAALNPAATKPVLTMAQEKGIKIISQSMEVPVADIWVSAEEYDMGHTIGVEAGKWIKEKLNGEAEVLVLANDRIPQMITRKEGIIAGMHEHSPNAKVVSVQEAVVTSEGMKVTETVLQAFPKLQVVVGINDAGTLGALAAVESAKRTTANFFIGGVDATAEALDKMKKGSVFRATVDNIPYKNGILDIDFAQKLMNGEKLEYRQVVPVEAITQAQVMNK